MDIEEYLDLFTPFGGTAAHYARRHFARFIATRRALTQHWNRTGGVRLLDVGAHWLHQSVLFATDGFEVSALDVPVTFDLPEVRSLAAAYRIRLLPNADLEKLGALNAIADDSFDLILFTEVIEHIAFNPVAMWRELYRVLRPGGRIILTTPNYYSLRRLVRHCLRFVLRRGGGANVADILDHPTYAHHWKEYSMLEVLEYFSKLSPDFVCTTSAYVEDFHKDDYSSVKGKMAVWIEKRIPILRPDMYVEIDIANKANGIVVEPHW